MFTQGEVTVFFSFATLLKNYNLQRTNTHSARW